MQPFQAFGLNQARNALVRSDLGKDTITRHPKFAVIIFQKWTYVRYT